MKSGSGRLNKVRTHLEVIRNYSHPDDNEDEDTKDNLLHMNDQDGEDEENPNEIEVSGEVDNYRSPSSTHIQKQHSYNNHNNNNNNNSHQSKYNDEYDEQDEVQDIVNGDEWEEKYREMRHELFNMKIVQPNTLSMTKASLKGKAEILRAQRWVEEQDLDREKEREDLFSKIRSLRYAISQPTDQDRMNMEKLKQEQMSIFEKLESERRGLESYLEKLSDRILLDDFGSDDESQHVNRTKNAKKPPVPPPSTNNNNNNNTSTRNALVIGRHKILSRIEENHDESKGKKILQYATKGDGKSKESVHGRQVEQRSSKDEASEINLHEDVEEEDEDEVRDILQTVGIEYKAYENNFEDEENNNNISDHADDNEEDNNDHQEGSNSEKSFDADAEINADLQRFKASAQRSNQSKDVNKGKSKNVENHQMPTTTNASSSSSGQRPQKVFTMKKKSNVNDENASEECGGEKMQLVQSLREQIQAVSEEMRRLSNGGNFGWLPEDHIEFLRVRSQHKNQVNTAKFIDDCFSVVPMYAREEIEDHASVFAKYILLDEEKKELLVRFKDAQAAAKQRDIEIKAAEASSAAVLKRNREMAVFEERQKKKELIQDWRSRKSALTQNVVEQEMEEKRILMNVLGEKRVRQNSQRDMTKALIKDYKMQKEEEIARVKALAQEKAVSQVRRISKAEVERIKAKEDDLVRKQMQRLAEVKAKKAATTNNAGIAANGLGGGVGDSEAESLLRIAQINREKFAHVEPRIKETTKAAERKVTVKYEGIGKVDRFGPTADSFAGNTLGLGGRLKVPVWRKSSNL